MIGAGGFGKFSKDAREIRVGLDAIRASRFDERVQAGTCDGAGSGLVEQPISALIHVFS
jgi:hypothetical protein